MDETYCKLCDVHFKKCIGFLQHKSKVHGKELEAFSKNYMESDLVYRCRFCQKRYATQMSVNYHVSKRHYKLKQKKLKMKVENIEKYCQLCCIVYKNPKFLRNHKKKIHGDELEAFTKELRQEDMEYECRKCNQRFYSKNTLDYHNHRKHGGMGNSTIQIVCKLCHVTYANASGLKKHMEVQHKEDAHLISRDYQDSTIQCALCDKKFLRDKFLAYHIRYEHKEQVDKNTYCTLCYVDFTNNWKLKSHINNIHSSEEESNALRVKHENLQLPFGCKFCDKQFLTE